MHRPNHRSLRLVVSEEGPTGSPRSALRLVAARGFGLKMVRTLNCKVSAFAMHWESVARVVFVEIEGEDDWTMYGV